MGVWRRRTTAKYRRDAEQKVVHIAGMAKLADALDLGSSGATHQSSNLCTRTKFIDKKLATRSGTQAQ